SALAPDATVASTGDYNGDGYADVLWRFATGGLGISYLVRGSAIGYVPLPGVTGDADRLVVGSVDIDGVPGDEIALQDRTTRRISILDPSSTTTAVRIDVVDPGSEWKAFGIGSS
ncbi:MAG TPA: hypothetical protein VKH41_13385, partial [Myxococcota bacterium]|nr:hypothetical protein [Myxococcota bacterium]